MKAIASASEAERQRSMERIHQSKVTEELFRLILSGEYVARAAAMQPREPQPVVSLGEMERGAILNALAHTGGDLPLAARLLGVGRTTLYRRVKRYLAEAGLTSRPAPSGSPQDEGTSCERAEAAAAL